MNWVQFKDSVSDMCLAGIVVAYWSLTHEAAGFSTFTVMTNIFVTEISEFSKNCNRFLFSHSRLSLHCKGYDG